VRSAKGSREAGKESGAEAIMHAGMSLLAKKIMTSFVKTVVKKMYPTLNIMRE
jgi:hypothetical protein